MGKRFRAARHLAGLPQEQLAELADLHPRALQMIEAGENLPMLSSLSRIQAALGFSWDELFNESFSWRLYCASNAAYRSTIAAMGRVREWQTAVRPLEVEFCANMH